MKFDIFGGTPTDLQFTLHMALQTDDAGLGRMAAKFAAMPPEERAQGFTILGGVYAQRGQYKNALLMNQDALRACEEGNLDAADAMVAIYNIGLAHLALKNYPAAEEALQRVVTESDRLGRPTDLSKALNALGGLKCSEKKYQEADAYLSRSLAVCLPESPSERFTALCNRGYNYSEQCLLNESEACYQGALDCATNLEQRSIALLALAAVSEEQGKKAQAHTQASEARQGFLHIGDVEQALVCLTLLWRLEGKFK